MSEMWRDRDRSVLWHPYTPDPAPGPAAQLFVKAEGAYVIDEKGKRYLDATASWWCQIHGHCHPRLVSALNRQASQLDQILFSPHCHPVALELAERLIAKLGTPFSRIFYSDDGSTAVEVALKMAIQYWVNRGEPRRRRFLSLQSGYHGDTLGTVAVGDVGVFQAAFSGGLAESVKAPIPHSDAAVDAFLALLDQHHEDLAAFIVEPLVMGAGGMIVYPKENLEKITRACRDRGVLVIFDEVFTGFGRTGTFFAMEQITSRPDIVCLSKGLTSGMLPLAVTATTENIFKEFAGGGARTFFHGHTFTANALGCAVALESLRLFDEEKVIERNRGLIDIFAEQSERFCELEVVREVRHQGMVWAVETRRDSAFGWQIATRLFDEGIWTRPLHNVLYFIAPYCVTPDELKRALDVLYSALRSP